LSNIQTESFEDFKHTKVTKGCPQKNVTGLIFGDLQKKGLGNWEDYPPPPPCWEKFPNNPIKFF